MDQSIRNSCWNLDWCLVAQWHLCRPITTYHQTSIFFTPRTGETKRVVCPLYHRFNYTLTQWATCASTSPCKSTDDTPLPLHDWNHERYVHCCLHSNAGKGQGLKCSKKQFLMSCDQNKRCQMSLECTLVWAIPSTHTLVLLSSRGTTTYD